MSKAMSERLGELVDILRRNGFVECDIPACNCGSWHHRYGLPERWEEICTALRYADVLNNDTGNMPLRAIQKLVEQRTALREALRELLDTQLSLMPPFEAGRAAQDAWADRRASAQNTARNLLEGK